MNDYMNQKRTRGFQIEISFSSFRGREILGTVSVHADSEDDALELARFLTSYKISRPPDKLAWQVREHIAVYG